MPGCVSSSPRNEGLLRMRNEGPLPIKYSHRDLVTSSPGPAAGALRYTGAGDPLYSVSQQVKELETNKVKLLYSSDNTDPS